MRQVYYIIWYSQRLTSCTGVCVCACVRVCVPMYLPCCSLWWRERRGSFHAAAGKARTDVYTQSDCTMHSATCIRIVKLHRQHAYIHTYIHTYIHRYKHVVYVCMYVMCAVPAMIPRYSYVYKHSWPTVVSTAFCIYRKHTPVKFPPNPFLVVASAVGYWGEQNTGHLCPRTHTIPHTYNREMPINWVRIYMNVLCMLNVHADTPLVTYAHVLN